MWKLRFLLAAAALGLAAAVTVDQLRPPPSPFETIVVTDREVPAGVPLTPGDLRTTRVPPESAPTDAVRDPTVAVGRQLAVAAAEGTVVSATVLVAASGPHGPAGTVVAAVRLGDPALAQILGPGMHVDLLAPSPSSGEHPFDAAVAAQHLARRALVLPGPLTSAGQAAGGLNLSATADEATDLVLVAVTPEEASLLANVSGWGAVTAVVVQ